MKLNDLRDSLFATFKLIAFVGFIITGALTIAMIYERVYKKLLNYNAEKIEKNKLYFYLIAVVVEGVFIYLYILLFKNSNY